VARRSRIDFAPLHTTATDVVASSSMSALTSNDRAAPRWTPPIPPVAMTAIPAAWASRRVALTVVEASLPAARSGPRSRDPAFATCACGSARRSRSAPGAPTIALPSTMAVVAGTAPCARTAASAAWAVSRLCGGGSPCAMSDDSRATTGRPSASAARTSSAIVSHSALMWWRPTSCGPGLR
jgi:hypothetical protein